MTYTREQLASFGNFLLKRYDVKVHSTDGKNTQLHQREVCHADIENWKDENPFKEQSTTYGFMSSERALIESDKIVSGWNAHIDDPLNLGVGKKRYLQFGDLTGKIPVMIRGAHSYGMKQKFDLELAIFGGDGWHTTRIYNVDANYVFGSEPEMKRYQLQTKGIGFKAFFDKEFPNHKYEVSPDESTINIWLNNDQEFFDLAFLYGQQVH